MRAKQRRTRVLAACAVALLSALVPGPVTPTGGARDGGIPGVSRVVRVLDRSDRPSPAAARGAETQPRKQLAKAAPSAPPTTEPREAPAHVAEEGDDVDPATLVRDVDVLAFSNNTTPNGDVPPPSGGPCPKASTCKTPVVRPARFKTDGTGRVSIPWKFNDEGRRNLRAPQGLLESAVRSATAEWSRWNSNISFPYAGSTSTTFAADGTDGSCDDGTNTVTWHQFDPSVIAAVATCTDPEGKTVRDVDLALNVTQHWEDIRTEPDSRHTFDIRSIVTHEIGHWLSLVDLYDGDSVAQTMMGNAVYGETRKRTLALGDIIGIQTAYPCGGGDSCPRSGIVDD